MSRTSIRPEEDLHSARETWEFFDAYERRFSRAVESMPRRLPWVEQERNEILAAARRCLGWNDSWVPDVAASLQASTDAGGFLIEHYQLQSWEGVHGAADLYVPQGAARKDLPAVLLACGHGAGGKRNPGYRRMAEHLARHGCAVLVADNIGQGERIAMGHRNVVDAFQSGLSLQGLIVMEAQGWLRWLQRDFDARRIAIIGNSGGGTLTMFLGAFLAGELAAISSSGYPSTFEFIARKEKKHCHCNIIPGIVGELEMWQLYGCMAPTPLLLFQGTDDLYFPGDLFPQTARKVAACYEHADAARRLETRLVPGAHPWDLSRRTLLTKFLCQHLKLPFTSSLIREDSPLAELPPCHPTWPQDALTADQLARQLSGFTGPAADHLWECFPPTEKPSADTIFGTPILQIAAQFEAFLKRGQGA